MFREVNGFHGPKENEFYLSLFRTMHLSFILNIEITINYKVLKIFEDLDIRLIASANRGY